MQQLIANEEFTSVKEAQAGLTRLMDKAAAKKSFYRVMRNNKAIGVLVPEVVWRDMVGEEVHPAVNVVDPEVYRVAKDLMNRYRPAFQKLASQ